MTEFEEYFGTNEEFERLMIETSERDAQRERECQNGTRLRCACGSPSIFTENDVPLCVPCGYHFAN